MQVVDGQLVAQGYNNGEDDGAPAVRPYVNTIHGHWSNSVTPDTTASADLPGYDVLDNADALIGYGLTWHLTGAMKWSDPATSGPVNLVATDTVAEEIYVTFGGTTRSTGLTSGLGSLTLLGNFNGSNGDDLDMTYAIGIEPESGPLPNGELFVITSYLSTNAPGVADSETIYTIMSPDGSNAMEKLHHPSLYLESQLGLVIPEPGTGLALGVMTTAGAMFGRKRRIRVAGMA